jgi:hypothetical protein
VKKKQWRNEYRTTVVCIDSYVNRIPEGRFYNPHYPNGVSFCGVVNLLTKMECMLDEMHFPEATSCIRTFADAAFVEQVVAPNQMILRKGKIATFSVRVMFRQNASWQGSVTWQEKGQEMCFRSVLELLLLMDSAAAEEAIT